MKKIFFMLFIGLVLTGCSAESNEIPTLNNSSSPKVNENIPVSKGTYTVGDVIVDMGNKFYFGGFVDEDTFVINKERFFSHGGSSVSYFYSMKEELVFTLSGKDDITLKLIEFDVKNNTISFEQLR